MRFPFEDLQKATGLTMRGMAAKLGNPRNTQTLYKYKREGFSFDMAEKYAGRFDFHPCEIWPAWMDESVAQENQRQRDLAAGRKRKQYRNPQARARIRARVDAYYVDCHDAILAQKRRHYALTSDHQRAKARAYYAANRERVKDRMRRQRAAS